MNGALTAVEDAVPFRITVTFCVNVWTSVTVAPAPASGAAVGANVAVEDPCAAAAAEERPAAATEEEPTAAGMAEEPSLAAAAEEPATTRTTAEVFGSDADEDAGRAEEEDDEEAEETAAG